MTVRHSLATLLLLLPPCRGHAQTVRAPVLVELFTSEGCSSCPPADALLARLDRDQPIPSAEVIVLSEHVDYWDSLGWRDRFSSHRFTERQSSYGSRFRLADVYTPQMVVAGSAQLIGSDAGAAARAIVQAARAPGLPLTLGEATIDGQRLSTSVDLAAPSKQSGDLFAALVTASEVTQVRSGENGGRTLRHAGVVRSLTRIGELRDLARGPMQIHLEVPDSAENLRLVVFAQAAGFGPVLGVSVTNLRAASQGSRPLAGK